MEAINHSCVNRLRTMIPRKSLKFKFDGMSDFDYRTLMNDPNIRIDTKVTRKFAALSREYKFNYNLNNNSDNEQYIASYIRKSMLDTGYPESDIVDMLVKELFGVRKTKKKLVFWSCYGDVVLANIQNNIDSRFTTCNYCGGRFYKSHNKDMVCPNCKDRKFVKSNTKTLICVDCGTPFEVKSSDTRSVCCKSCQKERRRTAENERQRKIYALRKSN